MATTRLHVYLGDGFSFYVEAQSADSIRKLCQGIEEEANALFDIVEPKTEYISILGLRDGFFNDLPLEGTIGDIFVMDDVVFPILDLLRPVSAGSGTAGSSQDGKHTVTILTITPKKSAVMHTAVSKLVSDRERQRLLRDSKVCAAGTDGDRNITVIQDDYQGSFSSRASTISLQLSHGSRTSYGTASIGSLQAISSVEMPNTNLTRSRVANNRDGFLGYSLEQTESYARPKSVEKCRPYCTPLAEFGDNRSICSICNEIKAYCASEGSYCTPFCKSGDIQKSKSSGLQFCSVCMSRYRAGKYTKGALHQCVQCHRPWLRLNIKGICRTCHCDDDASSHVPFQPCIVPLDHWIDRD